MSGAITENYGWDSEHSHGAADYLNATIRRLVREVSPKDVLDAGCGIGSLCADLAKDGYNTVGVDGDRAGIEIARSAYPDLRFEVARFESDPRELNATTDGKFDCVVSTEVVEHLYDPLILARYCFDALRPGGTLIISTPYHGYLKNLALALTNKWDYHHHALWHGGHIKFWSPKTLGELLRRAGFGPARVVGFGRAPFLWKSMILVVRRPADGTGR